MRRILTAFTAISLLAGFSGSALAADKYTFDKPHTQIMFSIDHLGFSRSSGKFLDYSGTIMFDREAPEKSSVEITIPVGSLEMGDKTWNEHLLAEKMFDVAKYPDMKFKSTAIKVTGEKTADITGDLTLHGVTKPVTLATTFRKAERVEMMNADKAGFAATTTIRRSDFGMSEGIPMVGDEVQITLEVEANKDSGATVPTPAPAAK